VGSDVSDQYAASISSIEFFQVVKVSCCIGEGRERKWVREDRSDQSAIRLERRPLEAVALEMSTSLFLRIREQQ
jgi:hypothetical protein